MAFHQVRAAPILRPAAYFLRTFVTVTHAYGPFHGPFSSVSFTFRSGGGNTSPRRSSQLVSIHVSFSLSLLSLSSHAWLTVDSARGRKRRDREGERKRHFERVGALASSLARRPLAFKPAYACLSMARARTRHRKSCVAVAALLRRCIFFFLSTRRYKP